MLLAWSSLGRPVGVVGEHSLLPMCLRGLMVSGLSAFTMLPQLTSSRLFTMDWQETADAHVLRAELSGFKKEEVMLQLEEEGGGGDAIRISCEKVVEIKEEKEDGWYHVERSSGRNHQRLRLPESADPKRMEAGMEDGVLTVTIQKKSSGFVNVS
ncbi:18.1 kDa class I heat shock protein (Fragment) [Linum grandiflorum]